MNWELVTALPPGGVSRTLLARCGRHFAVLRELDAEPNLDQRPLPPAVLALREVATIAGQRYAAYDVVRGVCLREVLEAFQDLELSVPVGLAVRAVLDAARAVSALTPPQPHGGLSDSSILLGFDGATRVIDFGAPRVTRFAPAGHPSAAADVFALGAVLHSALTGHGGHYGDSIAHGLTLPPPSQLNGEVPPVLDEVVMRALARESTQRQTDPDQLADELEAVLGDEFGAAAMAAAMEQVLQPRRQVLDEILAGGAAVVETMPSLGVARAVGNDDLPDPHDEKTGNHLVPWVTGLTRDGLPAVDAPARAADLVTAPDNLARPMRPIPQKTEVAWQSASVTLGSDADLVEPTRPRIDARGLGDAPDEATNRRPALSEQPAEPLSEDLPRTVIRPMPTAATTPVSLAESEVPPTMPRARAPDLTTLETVQKLAPVGPRNTSESERALAAGQHRVATPPLGLAQTDPDEPVLDAPPRRVGRIVVAVALVAVAAFAVSRLLSDPEAAPKERPPERRLETPDAARVEVAPVNPPPERVSVDASVEAVVDAGPPTVDAGAGEAAKKPAAKKPVVKKKPSKKKR